MMLFNSGFSPDFLSFYHLLWLIPVMALLAVVVDRVLAEARYFHPLVLFGHWAQWLEKTLNKPGARQNFWRGVLALILALLPLSLVVLLCVLSAMVSLWLWAFVQVVLLYLCIGWQSLQQHVSAVQQAQNLQDARQKLSWIVSRETGQLTDDEVAQAAIESLLENSSDALFVSLFWFALGGGVLALLHRWVNTLDAMWGYQNDRYRYFGRAAARLDDLLAFWPARLTALCLLLAAGRHMTTACNCWRQQARHCASPNGGVVMTAGAGALHVRLSERACYHDEWKQKPPMGSGLPATMADIPRAIRLVWRALALYFLLWVSVLLLAENVISGVFL